ncbi:acyltransferase family protein [Lysobacter sp. CFH 32150]|uniref:acyltransferase family protein n=1 Tax=Lysobacter sp. CFH 32150 TaxID=2927128 RepID=UPI001FA81459|nr:acyltransferase family protein [Lysobacter sp. CFH 32150]MCI4569078.1 acyltransferase [Lysobacter sp. CFH 32150]
MRIDIQALRGLAVLLVILQHAKAGFIDAGFLGVDIFFVISGFLITGMLARAITRGTFRFSEFYFRRAKRLLPAAYVTFAVTGVLAYFLLDAVEWHDFTLQLAGAVTFTGNLALWQQTGYFEGAAALKPLLHVWSLAVEEQYYLLLPAAMALLPRRYWSAGNVLLLLGSFALCVALAFTNPDAAFYLLPARGWELALGSVAALWTARSARAEVVIARLFLPALVVLLVIPVVPVAAPPFVNIALVCTATLLVILRRHEAFADTPIPRALARVGDASYSLYLVHWPIFAFINNVYAGDPSFGEPGMPVQLAGVTLSLLLGWGLYRHVELPVRRTEFRFRRRWVLAALATSAMLALVPLGLAARTTTVGSSDASAVDYAWLRRDNVGFGDACEGYERFDSTPACRNADAPAIMVWGDSFAMHLVPGLAATTDVGVVQATKSSCGPLLGLAQITPEHPRDFAERCLTFNQSVIDHLAETSSIRLVVLSSAFYPYFDPERRLLRKMEGSTIEQETDEAVAIAAMRATVGKLRALGKRVVIVAPPPSTGFDFSRCLERRARNRTLFGRFIDCDMPLAEYRASKHEVLGFLARVRSEADVEVVSFDAALCSESACITELDGTFLYRDEGHLSYAGSTAVAKRMQLGDALEWAAR